MAKWNLPEGKIYTQADLDAAVAAALRQAAKSLDAIMRDDLDSSGDPDFDAGFTEGAKCCLEEILAMIEPDAGAALDRALAAQRERDAKVAETHPMRFAGQTEDDVRAALAAAIRAQ